MKTFDVMISEIERHRLNGERSYFGMNVLISKETVNRLRAYYKTKGDEFTVASCNCKKATYDVMVRFTNPVTS